MSNPMTKLIGDKRRWRAYRARVKQLPPVTVRPSKVSSAI